MQLFFIHNIPIRILKNPSLLNMGLPYDLVWNYCPNLLAASLYSGHMLIQIDLDHLEQLLNEITQISFNKPKSITILINDAGDVSTLLQQYFKFTSAAGGIVTKGKQILMIYRARMWDLPKGRIEQGETTMTTATREVNEECGVKAVVTSQFYHTWHAFQINHVNILKETTWYTMDCLDDTLMAPQREEAIERVAWIDLDQLGPILEHTYESIKLLLRAYQNHVSLKKI